VDALALEEFRGTIRAIVHFHLAALLMLVIQLRRLAAGNCSLSEGSRMRRDRACRERISPSRI